MHRALLFCNENESFLHRVVIFDEKLIPISTMMVCNRCHSSFIIEKRSCSHCKLIVKKLTVKFVLLAEDFGCMAIVDYTLLKPLIIK